MTEASMSLATAVATAAVFAVFGFPFRYYQCWFSFSKIGTSLGSALYLAVAGGGGGVLGWGLAQLADAAPTSDPVLDGVLCGAAGALALRADFGARPKPDTPHDHFAKARSLLSASITWTADLLDAVTARRAEAWLTAMSDDLLAAEALRVQFDIRQQPEGIVPDKAKKEMSRMLVPAMEQLDDPAERATGRAHLISFCTRYYTERHLAKTPRESRHERSRHQRVGTAAG
jgi:hypothetical protein